MYPHPAQQYKKTEKNLLGEYLVKEEEPNKSAGQ
jgi:hypothetical protein